MLKVRPMFNEMEEIKKLFPNKYGVVGVGVTAWPRSGLSYLLPEYSILSLLETSDLEAIRENCEVVSVERDLDGIMPEKYNSSEILSLRAVQKQLQSKRAVFLYKASKRSSRLVEKLGLKLLGTPGEIRQVFEDKKAFRVEGEKAGLRLIPGKTLLVDDLDEKQWKQLQQQWGERLVFQLPDYTVGGGLGTFFIKDREDFAAFKDFVSRRREVREIVWVNVTKFIEGKEASMVACATKHGVVCGRLQAQVVDQPELAALRGRRGVWLGHDWYQEFEEKEQVAAEAVVRQWGEYIYRQGYRGVFGLDLMVDNQGEIWPVECNARYTGAFPSYTMMQLDQGEMPLDVWHLLEWLEIGYEMDLPQVQAVARRSRQGAQLVLHNLERKFVTPTRTVSAGVYRIVSNGSCQPLSPVRRPRQAAGARRGSPSVCRRLLQIEWVRPGFSLLDIKNEQEVILCDRIAQENWVLRPAERLGRLLFKRPVVDGKGRLRPEIQELVRQIYDLFELMPVEAPGE